MEIEKSVTTSKANKSFKWTALAEITAKIIAPLINMVLARFISPEIFGIVATLSIVTGLATTLSESGFARYVQQHQFLSDEERKKSTQTSLTSSIGFGIILFSAIAIWSMPISSLIGASGYEGYLIVAAGAIPFHSIISVESAILKRDFRFRETAFIRVGSTILTAAIEITLGVMGYGLIALTWGQLISSFVLAITLFFFLKDKKIIGFSFTFFKQSFKDNFLFIVESLCIWAVSALDILLLGTAFGETLVGVYKLAFNTEKGIVALIGAIFSPVLISLFSKFSYEDPEFLVVLRKYQRAVAFVSIPAGIGILIFREGLTNLFLGSGWEEAIPIFGFFALFDCFKIPISDFISTLMISKGKPLGSIIPQIIYIGFVALCCAFAKELGFETFVILRAMCTLVLVLAYSFMCKTFTGISPWVFYKNLLLPLCGALIMAMCCLPFVLVSSDIATTLIGVAVGAICYFSFMHFVFRKESKNFFSILYDEKFNYSRTDSVKIFKIKLNISCFGAVLASVFAIPLAMSVSLLSSQSTSSKQIAESFDICETANRQTKNNLTRLEIQTYNKYYRDDLVVLKDSISFANLHSKWPNYYNFYITTENNEKFSLEYNDKDFDAGLISLYSTHVASYALNDLNQPRMETAGLYVLVTDSINQGFQNPIFISKKFADGLLENSVDYHSLIGKTLKYESIVYHIANIIDDNTWLNDELNDEYGIYAIVGGNTIFKYGTKIVAYFTNQPFVLNDYFSMLSNGEYQKYELSVNCYLQQESKWAELESHSNQIERILNFNFDNRKMIWNKEAFFGLFCFLGISLVAIFILILFAKSYFYEISKVSYVLQPAFVILFGGFICVLMNLLYKKYNLFILNYAFTFGIPIIFIAICIPLVLFLLCTFRKRSNGY